MNAFEYKNAIYDALGVVISEHSQVRTVEMLNKLRDRVKASKVIMLQKQSLYYKAKVEDRLPASDSLIVTEVDNGSLVFFAIVDAPDTCTIIFFDVELQLSAFYYNLDIGLRGTIRKIRHQLQTISPVKNLQDALSASSLEKMRREIVVVDGVSEFDCLENYIEDYCFQLLELCLKAVAHVSKPSLL